MVVTVIYVFCSYGKITVTTFKKDAKHETVEGEKERLREEEMLKICHCNTVSSCCSNSLSVLKLRPFSIIH